MIWSAVFALCLAAAAIYTVFRQSRRSADDQVFALFGLEPADYELLGFDLGDVSRKIVLRGDGLIGAPDAVFRRRSDGRIVIGDYKSRRFRGQLSTYERYQMMLYMGVARRRYGSCVDCLVSYGCGHVEALAFDARTYAELLALIPTVRRLEVTFPSRPGGDQRRRRLRLASPR